MEYENGGAMGMGMGMDTDKKRGTTGWMEREIWGQGVRVCAIEQREEMEVKETDDGCRGRRVEVPDCMPGVWWEDK